MQRRARTGPRSGCPISVALERFGDPWSLLIIRDLLFQGFRTFKEFEAAGEGIATNILSDRLERLEEVGILSKERDPADARRVLYGLTPKGADLAAVLVELVLWSAKHEQTEAPPDVVHEMQKRRKQFVARLQSKWRR